MASRWSDNRTSRVVTTTTTTFIVITTPYWHNRSPQNIFSWSEDGNTKRWNHSYWREGKGQYWSNDKVLSHKASWPLREKRGFPIRRKIFILQKNQILAPSRVFFQVYLGKVSNYKAYSSYCMYLLSWHVLKKFKVSRLKICCRLKAQEFICQQVDPSSSECC